MKRLFTVVLLAACTGPVGMAAAGPVPPVLEVAVERERSFYPATLAYDGKLLEETKSADGESACYVDYVYDGRAFSVTRFDKRGEDLRCPPSERAFYFETGNPASNSGPLVRFARPDSWRTVEDTPEKALYEAVLSPDSEVLPSFLAGHYDKSRIRVFVDKTVPYVEKIEFAFVEPVALRQRPFAAITFKMQIRSTLIGDDKRPILDRIALMINSIVEDGSLAPNGPSSRAAEEITNIKEVRRSRLSGGGTSGGSSATGIAAIPVAPDLEVGCASVSCRLRAKAEYVLKNVLEE